MKSCYHLIPTKIPIYLQYVPKKGSNNNEIF